MVLLCLNFLFNTTACSCYQPIALSIHGAENCLIFFAMNYES